MSRNRRFCCVGGCNETSETQRLFCLPANDFWRNLWLHFLLPTKPSLIELSKEQLVKRRVCNKHFDKYQFDDRGQRLRYSYPCLFTEAEIAHGIPLSTAEWNVWGEHNYFQIQKPDKPSLVIHWAELQVPSAYRQAPNTSNQAKNSSEQAPNTTKQATNTSRQAPNRTSEAPIIQSTVEDPDHSFEIELQAPNTSTQAPNRTSQAPIIQPTVEEPGHSFGIDLDDYADDEDYAAEYLSVSDASCQEEDDDLSFYLDLPKKSGNKDADEQILPEPNEDLHEGFMCNNCSGEIKGYRYTCVQCPDYDLCASCEARGAHCLHYVLRIPRPKPYAEIQSVVNKIREQLKYGVDAIVPSTRGVDHEIKEEVKDEGDPLEIDVAPINVYEEDINYTEGDINYTEGDINYTEDDINYTKDDINYTKDDINYTKDDINYTKDDINYTEDIIYSEDFGNNTLFIQEEVACFTEIASIVRRAKPKRKPKAAIPVTEATILKNSPTKTTKIRRQTPSATTNRNDLDTVITITPPDHTKLIQVESKTTKFTASTSKNSDGNTVLTLAPQESKKRPSDVYNTSKNVQVSTENPPKKLKMIFTPLPKAVEAGRLGLKSENSTGTGVSTRSRRRLTDIDPLDDASS